MLSIRLKEQQHTGEREAFDRMTRMQSFKFASQEAKIEAESF